jgi:predicted small lipoprotein YifL
MKKLFAILLSAAPLLCLAACGNKPDTTPDNITT